MTQELAEFFKEALEYGGEEPEIVSNYSGRGMMGKTTFGIIFPSETLLMACVLDYIRETGAQIPINFDKIKSDNCANEVIWY